MDYKKMDSEALNRMQLHQIQELENDGLVDGNFRECHSLKGGNGPLFFLDLIQVFLTDVHTSVNEMAKTLEQPIVDYNLMYCQCIKLKGGSSCFGAFRIRDVCYNLRTAIDRKHKEGCLQALENINHQYITLYNRLENIVKIEQEIVSRGT